MDKNTGHQMLNSNLVFFIQPTRKIDTKQEQSRKLEGNQEKETQV